MKILMDILLNIFSLSVADQVQWTYISSPFCGTAVLGH